MYMDVSKWCLVLLQDQRQGSCWQISMPCCFSRGRFVEAGRGVEV
jgi:hypothetical protein